MSDRWAGLRAAAEYAQSVTFDNQKQRAVLALLDERDRLEADLSIANDRGDGFREIYKEAVAERDQAVALLRAWSHWWDDRLPTHAVYAPVPETRAFLAALSDEENP